MTKRRPMGIALKHKSQSGFTLLEVIIAIGLLGSICVVTINILSDQLNIREKLTNINSTQHTMDVVMSRISNDLRAAYITPFQNQSFLNLSYRPVVPKIYLKNNDLSFFTFNFRSLTKNSSQSNESFVRYFIDKDENTKKNFLYRVYDTDMIDNITKDHVGIKQTLLMDVKEFKVLFWTGRNFVTDWDSTSNDTMNRIPKMVHIHLATFFKSKVDNLADKDRASYDLDTVVYLPNSMGEIETEMPDWNEYKWK